MALGAVSVGVAGSAYAASRSDQLTRATYCDFGDNKGQYAVHGVNALLEYLREENGIQITYLNSDIDPYIWPDEQPLINYDSRIDAGPAGGIGYNFIATVQHNGVLNPTFTASTIGDANAIHYAGIEYRYSTNNTFLLVPGIDYKVTRLSKIITDVTGSGVYTGDYPSLVGQTWYRSGSGTMYSVDANGNREREAGGYAYCIGGIMKITSASRNAKEGQVDVRNVVDDSGSVVINKNNWWQTQNIDERNPLPFVIQAGDSGSPTWIYDSATGSYLYAGGMQSGEGTFFSQARYAGQWTAAIMEYFNQDVVMPDTGVIHIGMADEKVAGHYDAENKVESRPYQGKVTDSNGVVLQTYLGLQTGNHTWKDLNNVQNNDNWYAYGNQYLNTGANLTYADLFETQDLVFRGSGDKTYNIEMDGDVDLGLGYMRFTNEDIAAGVATYNLSNKEGVNSRLDTAGFIVDAGVDVYMSLNGTPDHAREWRKIGDGNLHITGSGDNSDILLNLGGSGTTYLERNGGYAAYNVLANNGTTVVIQNTDQIKRDFTFGYGGALLDMNGLDMTWNNGDTPDKEGFAIHALTDEAVISNSLKGTVSTLTWTQGGEQEYLGSFTDTKEGGVLQFVYNAQEENSRLVLHSIYTCLGNAEPVDGQKSGVFVKGGTLALQGTNTQHAPGSLGANFSNARYFSEDDWHYADSATSVTVDGGIFELGHHARLTGDVTVNKGGTFLMREGVTHRHEYVEGGYELMDTNEIAGYFGLKGNVHLNEGGTMVVKFNDNADSALVYNGSIDGTGHLMVDSGIIGGLVVLGGDNTSFTGSKTLQRGGMHVTDLRALGSTDTADSKWNITNSGYLVLDTPFDNLSHDEVLQYVHSDSNGILALTQDTTEAFDLSNHRKLIIGANQGEVVQYGSKDKELAAQMDDDGKMYWRLGGGGGELVVNFHLNDQGAQPTNLVLGADYAKGVVYLTNKNDFSGTITFKGGVTLRYDADDALGNATFSINYTNRVMVPGGLDKVLQDSAGALLVDQISDKDLNLTNHTGLAIGSQGNVSYQGDITVAQNAEYHFGGATGTLSVEKGLRAFGRNNLDVDGQTFSDGEILLKSEAAITGDVTVRGRNQDKATQVLPETGDIVLGLGTNNAIAQTQSVKLFEGGFIDLHGTEQTVKDLNIDSGGGVIDTSDSRDSKLRVSMTQDLTWSGSMDAGAVYVGPAAEGQAYTLTLSGSSSYDELQIEKGTKVVLGADNALSAFGTTYVQSGATLDANKKNTWGNVSVSGTLNANEAGFSGGVTLTNGTLYLKQGSLSADSTLISYGGRVVGKNAQINGVASFLSGTTVFSLGDLSAISDTDYARIAGTVDIAEGATLELEYGAQEFMPTLFFWKYSISSADFNVAETWVDEEGVVHKEEKGTLNIQAAGLFLDGSDQNFGGTVQVSGDRLVSLYGEKGTKAFDRFLNAGETQLYSRYGNHANWLLHRLDGTGTVTADTNAWVKIDGEGDFNGTFTKDAGTLELAHTNALAQAQLNLRNGAILAVSAETAKVKSLGGSGKLLSGAVGDSESTRNTTLEITTGGTTYSGSVAGDEQHGLSLRMNGSGTQTFSGADVKLQDIDVQSGTLAFTNEIAPVVYGDISIAQGATLNYAGKALSLEVGQTLRIVGGAAETPAAFSGNLDFAGGRMLFDSAILSAEAAALNLTGTAGLSDGTDALSVNFANDGLLENQTYLLSTGNWEALSGKVSSNTLIYHTATFSATSDGLFVDIGERTDIQIWLGTSTKNNWTAQDFGSEDNRLQAESTAVFNDDAENSNVSITESAQVKEMVFDNNENVYKLVAGSGTTVQADSLRQLGAGSTELAMGNFQIGEAAVEAGSLILGNGSRVGDISVAEDASLVLKDEEAANGKVSGKGSVLVNWAAGKSGQLDADVASLSVESGTVEAAHTLADTVSVKDGGQYHATAGTHSSAILLEGADEPADTAALQLGDGVEVEGRVTVAANAAVGVDSEAAGTISGNVEVAAGTILTKTGDGTLTLDADNSTTLAGGLVIADGTVKAGNNHALGATSTAGRIVVAEGGTLDVNGIEGAVDAYAIIMAGGTLANTGAVVGTSKRQLVTSMVLTADSTVCAESGHEFALIANGYAPTAINLQGKTLEKTGSGTYSLTRTTVTGGEGGTLKVSEGILNFLTNGGAGSLQADLEMAGGTVSGTVNPGQNITIRTTDESKITAAIVTGGNGITFTGDANLNDSGVISGEGSVSKQGAGELTLGAANTFTGGTTISKGAVVANNNKALGSGAVSVGAEGTLKLAANLTLSGGMVNSGTIDLGTNKTLTLNGQEGGTSYTVGSLANAESAALAVGNYATAAFESSTAINCVLGQAGSTVVVAKGSTLTLQSADRSGNTTFYGVDNEGTISIKGSNGDIRLFGSADDQVFNLGHLDIDGISDTSYILTSGSVNYTSDIAVKSLSGGGSGHTLQVTTCYSGDGDGKVVDLVLGEQQDDTALYTGKIQYGVGTRFAKSGSGMNVVLKDENVASQAVLEAVFNGDATQSATITVDTALAKVKGLTGSGNASRSLEVSGTQDSENRVIELVGDSTYTYGGKLGAHLDVVHSGSGTQNITGGADDFSGSVAVDAGVLNMLNIAKLVVNDVSIGAHATLGVYSGSTATADAAHEGILTIRDGQSLTAEGPGSTLNANLVMETGSILDVHGMEGTGMTLSGALTLNKGMNLSQADLAAMMGLGADETYNLFNGVDALTLSVTPYDKITPDLRIDAADWFRGIEPERFYMVYDGDNVGVYCMYSIPEPATGTLSLLALAALAARRRRK